MTVKHWTYRKVISRGFTPCWYKTDEGCRVAWIEKKGPKWMHIRFATGERKRKSVRGCIVNHNLSILNLAIVKKGEGEIEGLTDKQIPRRLGPKRANNIRKLFSLEKSDPVTQYVIRRTIEKEGKKAKAA